MGPEADCNMCLRKVILGKPAVHEPTLLSTPRAIRERGYAPKALSTLIPSLNVDGWGSKNLEGFQSEKYPLPVVHQDQSVFPYLWGSDQVKK